MLCYKDKTFCPFHESCKDDQALTLMLALGDLPDFKKEG